MKKIEAYGCEYCGGHYLDSDQAITCEQSHVNVGLLVISEAKYTPGEYGPDNDHGFPSALRVDDHSGHLAEYRLVREGYAENFEPFIPDEYS